MGRKEFQTSIVIGGKTSPSLNNAFNAARKQADLTSKSMNGINDAVKKLGGLLAAGFSIAKIVEFGKTSADAYNESVEAATKLQTIMRQRMGATDAQIGQIQALTAAQQQLGVVEDDAQVFGAQQMATFLNSTDSLKTLIPAMNNLAVQQHGVNATSEDMVSIGNLMGKAMQGQTTSLRKVGITFNAAQEEVLKYGTEQQKAAMLASVITENVGEMNKAIADTPAGKVQQVKNAWGNMKEVIGESIMELAARFTPIMEQIIPKIENLAEKLGPIFEDIGDRIQWAIDNGEKIISVLKLAAGAIVAATAAQVAFNTVTKAGMIINSLANGYKLATQAMAMLRSGTKLATIQQTLLNGTMFANPAGIIIAGIAGMVAAFVYFWNTSEKFRQFWIGLWAGSKTAFISFVNLTIKGMNLLIKAVTDPINALILALNLVPGVKIPAITFKIPEIPMMGTGGTVTTPRLAIVGDKSETIVPHGNNQRNRALLQEAAAGVGGSTAGINITFAPVINGGGSEIKNQIIEAQEEFERRMDAYFARKQRLRYGI